MDARGRFCYAAGMSKLVRFFCALFVTVVVVWFSVTVPLGNHTLWGHLIRIFRTNEAQDLIKGAKQTAKETTQQAVEDWRRSNPPKKQGEGQSEPTKR